MILQKSFLNLIFCSLVGSVGVINLVQLPTLAQFKSLNTNHQLLAQYPPTPDVSTPSTPTTSDTSAQGQPSSTLNFQPPEVGQPPSTIGLGSRGAGSCLQDQTQHIIPLMPANNFALTVQKYPTFFWYLPSSTAQTVIFTLLEQHENEIIDVIYEDSLNISSQPGIISISLPNTVNKSLKEGKSYHWYIDLICDDKNLEKNPSADGWIKLIKPNPNLVNDITKALPRQRPAFYAQAGIWQDTLTTLVELRRLNSLDPQLTADWKQLLKSVGLEAISNEPLLDCCQQKK